MSLTADEILKKFHDVVEKMQDEAEKDRDERVVLKEKVEKVEQDAMDALAELKSYREQFVTPGAPLDEIQQLYAEQKGGIFGGKFRMPYAKMISLPATSTVLNSSEQERLRTIQDLHDANVLRFYSIAKKLRPGQNASDILKQMADTEDFKLYAQHLVQAGYIKAANDILNPGGGTGANLDFTLLSAQLIDLVEVAAILPAQFLQFTQTTADQEIPAFRGRVKAVAGGTTSVPLPQDDLAGVPWSQANPPTAASLKPTFGKIKFSAKHCLGFLLYTDDMLEDSIVPILPILREEAVNMINLAREDAIVNGDVTATHFDSDTSEPAFATQFNGLRHMGENITVDSGDTIIAAEDANLMLRKMGAYAQRLENIMWVMHVQEWLRLAADPDLKTVDKAGDRATLRRGVVNQLSGVDIVLSPEMRRDLNATGVYDGITMDRATTVMCDRTRFYLSRKNQLDVESIRVPHALANWIQADLRTDFQPKDLDSGTATFTGGTDSPVVVQINVNPD